MAPHCVWIEHHIVYVIRVFSSDDAMIKIDKFVPIFGKILKFSFCFFYLPKRLKNKYKL